MKVKQPRRWKRQTPEAQNQIALRIFGQIFWAALLLGGIGSLCSFGFSNAQAVPTQKHTLSAAWTEKIDAKLTAAFPARKAFLRAITESVAATGGNRIGDVYFTNERLLKCPNALNMPKLMDTADAINCFYETYQIPTAVIAVPSAGEFYANDLLEGLSYPSQLESIDQFYQAIDSPVRKIDAYRILFTATDDYIYYRTDEKWSSYGAYCVYHNIMQRLGFAPVSYDQYIITHVASFRGNLYDACLYDNVTPDILDIYQFEGGSQITEMTAYPAGKKSEARKLGNIPEDGSADPDTFYLGEPCEKIVIQTDLDNQKKLLLFKDSYADCMVPFFVQHYSEICILDVAHMEHTLSELADVSDYTQVLLLCSADTFAEEQTAVAFAEEDVK